MRIAMFLATAMLLLPAVTGLGVAPGELEITYNANQTLTFDLIIINNELKNLSAEIRIQGGLSEYITPETQEIMLDENTYEKRIRVKIQMPESLEPGPHDNRILVTEQASGEGMLSSRVTVAAKISVMAPYPGKYARLRMTRMDFERGREGNFLITAENLGTDQIENAMAVVNVENVSLESKTKSIGSRGEVFFAVPWTPQVQDGIYTARAILEYDGKTAETSRNFNVGEQKLVIQNIDVEEFNYESSTIISLTLKNDWNTPLRGAYAEIEFLKDGQSQGGSPTIVSNWDAGENKTLRATWDSSGVGQGIYDLEITLHYNDREEIHRYSAILTERGLIIQDYDKDISLPKELPRVTQWIIGILIILLIIVFLKYSFKNKK